MKRGYFLWFCGLLLVLLVGCKKDEVDESLTISKEKLTVGVTSVEMRISYVCGVEMTKTRVYVSEKKDMSKMDWCGGELLKGGKATYELSDLEDGKKYYYYYWFTNGELEFQSDVRSFTTEALSGMNNGHAWVNLGTGVMWATMNVGADNVEGYGNLYAWGETESKSSYSWGTYKWADGSETTLTKYCSNSSYGKDGFTDDLTTLAREDDVASVKWGGKWRMPTKGEWERLQEECTWVWTTQNGVKGYRVSGRTGMSIFLPAAGDSGGDAGEEIWYYSSSLFESKPRSAWVMGLDGGELTLGAYRRYVGNSVRGVLSK